MRRTERRVFTAQFALSLSLPFAYVQLESERRIYHRKDVSKAAGWERKSEQRKCPEHD